MRDIEKTKAQLMDELGLLRQRITELEALETERKRAEDALRESDERYQTLFDNANEAICVAQDERIVFANLKTEELYGYSAEELASRPFVDFIHEEDREMVLERHHRRLSGEDLPVVYQFRIVDKAGHTKWVELKVSLFSWNDKPAALCFQADITDRKKAEEAIRREKERTEQYLHIAGVMLATVDADETISLMNVRGYEILGYEEGELTGRNWFDTLVPQRIRGEVRSVFRKLMAGDIAPVEFYENQLLTKDGEERLIAFHNTVIRGPSGQIFGTLLSAEDITERERAEEELRKHHDYLEELVAERSTELQTANEQLRRELARRKRVEKAQKLSEAKYRALFEEAADPFVVIDAETGAMVEFNQRAHQNLGHSREEFEKLRICDIDVIQSAEDIAACIQKTATEGTMTFETKHRTESGEIRDVQIAAGGLSIHGRHFIQSVWHDITERRRAEERVRESEELYRSLVELSPDTVAVQSKGKIVFVNSAGARLVGAAHVEQLLGMPVADFLHPDYRETVAERLRKAAEEGTSRPLIEQKFIRLDGTEVDVEVAAMPLTYQGKPAMQLVARDITERKQAEEALRRSEERYRTILEEMEDSYFEVDIAGNFAFVNDATCHSLGYPRDEVIGMDYRRYVADEDVETVYRAFNQVYRTGKPRRGFSYKVTRKDGSTGFVEISVFPVRNKEGDITGFRGIGRDITDRRKAEAKIEGALREKEVLLKEIHHRVKNNMQIISSLLNLQAKRVTSREAADILRRSQSRVRSMALIHEALYQSEDLARIDFHRYIRNLADDLFTLYSVKRGAVKLGIDVDNICLDINTAIPCGLVINELVSNSLKHAFPNDREGEIRIGFRSGKDGGMILTVSDNGVGFPNLDFRDTETVGLQLVTTLVAQLGSTIELDRNGKTTFRMRFREP